jgi:hypothetical protein
LEVIRQHSRNLLQTKQQGYQILGVSFSAAMAQPSVPMNQVRTATNWAERMTPTSLTKSINAAIKLAVKSTLSEVVKDAQVDSITAPAEYSL